MSDAPELLAALARVRAGLSHAQVEHVFIGALPVLAWGRPRATTDLDVVVFTDPAHFATLTERFAQQELEPGKHVGPAESTDPLPDIALFWTRSSPSIRVDVFIAKMDFERAVLASARTAQVMGEDLRLASPEASIIYKLIASRSKDLADVETIFEARTAAGEALDWEFLTRWAREWEIQERLAPFEERYRDSASR